MKSPSKSLQRRQAVQAGHKIDQPRHEVVDLMLRQHAQRLALQYLDFCELAEECISGKFYERFGFVDAEPYFQERIGVSYRTLRRRMAILEALHRLPPDTQPRARLALAEIGVSKASILAPVLGRPDEDWEKWVEFAKAATEDAVQAAVSDLTEAKRRGSAPADDWSRFYKFVLAQVPPERRSQVEQVFRGIMALADSDNEMGAFLVLIDLGQAELVHTGHWKDG